MSEMLFFFGTIGLVLAALTVSGIILGRREDRENRPTIEESTHIVRPQQHLNPDDHLGRTGTE